MSCVITNNLTFYLASVGNITLDCRHSVARELWVEEARVSMGLCISRWNHAICLIINILNACLSLLVKSITDRTYHSESADSFVEHDAFCAFHGLVDQYFLYVRIHADVKIRSPGCRS